MGHMADYYMTTPRFYCMFCGDTMIDESGNVLKTGSQFIKDTMEGERMVFKDFNVTPIRRRKSLLVCSDCYDEALKKDFSPHLYWNEDGIIHAY